MRKIIHKFEQLLWEEDVPEKDSALKLYQELACGYADTQGGSFAKRR